MAVAIFWGSLWHLGVFIVPWGLTLWTGKQQNLKWKACSKVAENRENFSMRWKLNNNNKKPFCCNSTWIYEQHRNLPKREKIWPLSYLYGEWRSNGGSAILILKIFEEVDCSSCFMFNYFLSCMKRRAVKQWLLLLSWVSYATPLYRIWTSEDLFYAVFFCSDLQFLLMTNLSEVAAHGKW